MTPQKIKKDIENHFGIPDLSTKERTRPLPQLKGLYYRIATKITDASYEEIAKELNSTHAMVTYWREKIKFDMRYYPEIEKFYNNYAQSGWHVWEKDNVYA